MCCIYTTYLAKVHYDALQYTYYDVICIQCGFYNSHLTESNMLQLQGALISSITVAEVAKSVQLFSFHISCRKEVFEQIFDASIEPFISRGMPTMLNIKSKLRSQAELNNLQQRQFAVLRQQSLNILPEMFLSCSRVIVKLRNMVPNLAKLLDFD